MRTSPLAVGALTLIAILATGCTGEEGAGDGDGSEAPQSPAGVQPTAAPSVTAGIFMPPGESRAAITYDETAVPEGATSDVQVRVQDGSTFVQFSGTGLEADRDFGAHVHTRPCGEEPEDAGPHYQNEEDPAADAETPSTDPAYANPENEVWLDFTTDGTGAVTVSATVPWEFREGGAASLVLHERHTATDHDEAGTAGDRLACVSVDF
ncbi:MULTISPECIES: superoxide dismutase family protein [Nocardiopsis]|uniref:Superoxide dismutase family protein n=1 Tax=Nocardiopsis lambiniae TaxID=3075539 RepID=A0ABU2M6B9_9ACTN|nr:MULTISPECIES: superoxide dismutase family protein [unclassified Nocardiopsis]MDE3723141.1 superoxide dismutase family protein [Nocardiopsis sp. N85]MDT0328123.1 superoxide dismutase family protein [Nocardiopsis sp. DSM 44743]